MPGHNERKQEAARTLDRWMALDFMRQGTFPSQGTPLEPEFGSSDTRGLFGYLSWVAFVDAPAAGPAPDEGLSVAEVYARAAKASPELDAYPSYRMPSHLDCPGREDLDCLGVYAGRVPGEALAAHLRELAGAGAAGAGAATSEEVAADDLPLAFLRTDCAGSYQPGSLEVSPVLWAVRQLRSGHPAAGWPDAAGWQAFCERLDAELRQGLGGGPVTLGHLRQLAGRLLRELVVPLLRERRGVRAGARQLAVAGVLCEPTVAAGPVAATLRNPGRMPLALPLFRASDLRFVRDHMGEAGEAALIYAAGPATQGLAPGAQSPAEGRIDLMGAATPEERRRLDRLYVEVLRPEREPLGRWPSGRAVPLMHLVATSLLAGDGAETDKTGTASRTDGQTVPSTPVLALACQPGSGKQTLLRDLLAALATERARMLAAFADPDDAFAPPAPASPGNTTLTCAPCPAVARARTLVVCARDREAAHDLRQALDTRSLLAGRQTPAGESPRAAWLRCRREFLLQLKVVEGLRAERAAAERAYDDARQTLAGIRELEGLCERLKEEALASARDRDARATRALVGIEQHRFDEALAEGSESAAPGGSDAPSSSPDTPAIPYGADADETLAFCEAFVAGLEAQAPEDLPALRALTDDLRRAIGATRQLQDELAHARSELHARRHSRAEAERTIAAAGPETDARGRHLLVGDALLDDLLSDDPAAARAALLSSPRHDPTYDRAREELLRRALELTDAFVRASARCQLDLSLSERLLDDVPDAAGRAEAPTSPDDDLTAPLQAALLAQPVLVTTLGQLHTICRHVPHAEAFDLLVFDEAEHKLPEAAAAPLLRARRAAFLGGEPVAAPTTPDVAHLLARACPPTAADARPDATEAPSMLELACARSPVGTFVPASDGAPARWTGLPLVSRLPRVDQAAPSPALGTLGTDTKEPTGPTATGETGAPAAAAVATPAPVAAPAPRPAAPAPAAPATAPATSTYPSPAAPAYPGLARLHAFWHEVPGPKRAIGDNFVPAQGDCVVEQLGYHFSSAGGRAGAAGPAPDFCYVACSLASVARGMREHLCTWAQDATGANLEAVETFCEHNVGTTTELATLPERHFNMVILVLGCDQTPESHAAVDALGRDALDVAVSRAWACLRVVGSLAAWRRNPNVWALCQAICASPEGGLVPSAGAAPDARSTTLGLAALPLRGRAPAQVPGPAATSADEALRHEGEQVVDALRHGRYELSFGLYYSIGFESAEAFDLAFEGLPEVRDHLLQGLFLSEHANDAFWDRSKWVNDLSIAAEAYFRDRLLEPLARVAPDHRLPRGRLLGSCTPTDPKPPNLGNYWHVIRTHRYALAYLTRARDARFDEGWWDEFQQALGRLTNSRNDADHIGTPEPVQVVNGYLFHTPESPHIGVLVEREAVEALREAVRYPALVAEACEYGRLRASGALT